MAETLTAKGSTKGTPDLTRQKRSTTQMTPNGQITKKSTRSFFDFDTFESKVVGKNYSFNPLPETASVEQILAVVGNDSKKLAALVSKGLEAEAGDQAYQSLDGWMELDENKAVTSTPYVPSGADASDVNDLKRTLARTIFGYSVDDPKEVKDAKMQQALDFIKNTPAIREKLKTQATNAA